MNNKPRTTALREDDFTIGVGTLIRTRNRHYEEVVEIDAWDGGITFFFAFTADGAPDEGAMVVYEYGQQITYKN